LDLNTGMHGCRFSIGIRNSHDKSMRLAMTVGYRVFVCENMAFHGDFQPVLAKHSKNFSLTAALSIGVDEMQRNFAGMRTQVDAWRQSQLSDVAAKLIIYRAFRRWEGASGINQKNSLASAPRRCRVGASGDRRKVPVLTNLVQEHCPKGP
jgi:hypothetical protein